jgi:hypothetical protein
MLYDQRCFFEQHEYEAAPWPAARYAFNTTHLDAYLRVFPSSELQHDHGDRNASTLCEHRSVLYGMMMPMKQSKLPYGLILLAAGQGYSATASCAILATIKNAN